jgi:methyl-accepting chemotaxis protein
MADDQTRVLSVAAESNRRYRKIAGIALVIAVATLIAGIVISVIALLVIRDLANQVDDAETGAQERTALAQAGDCSRTFQAAFNDAISDLLNEPDPARRLVLRVYTDEITEAQLMIRTGEPCPERPPHP